MVKFRKDIGHDGWPCLISGGKCFQSSFLTAHFHSFQISTSHLMIPPTHCWWETNYFRLKKIVWRLRGWCTLQLTLTYTILHMHPQRRWKKPEMMVRPTQTRSSQTLGLLCPQTDSSPLLNWQIYMLPLSGARMTKDFRSTDKQPKIWWHIAIELIWSPLEEVQMNLNGHPILIIGKQY